MTRKPPHLFLYTSRQDGLVHWREPGVGQAPGRYIPALRYLCGQWAGVNDELDSLAAVEDAPIEPDTCVDCVRWADELWPLEVAR
jgi:hypothetical protein